VISPIMHTVALLTAVLSCLFSLTMAQNDTFNLTAYKTCPYDGVGADLYNATGSVNSTGRVGFRFDPVAGWGLEEYSLSVTFDEKRTPNTKYGTYKPEVIHYTHSWLSVPQYSKGNACVYQLRAQNASASGTGMNGCEGVLSQKCYDSLLNSAFDFPSPKAQKQRCPAFNITEAIMEACGNMTDDSASRGSFVIPNAGPIDFGNTTCTVDSPKGMSKLNDTRTYAINRVSSLPEFTDSGRTFDWYDRSVLQTRPFLVAVANLQDSRISPDSGYVALPANRLVCVAPTNVTEGSRVPELKFESREDSEETGDDGETENEGDQNAASHTSGGDVAQLASYAATVVGLMFVVM